ncbi:MAG: M3 family metallopeptidase [Betaproteobacteria bacterium]
MNPLLDFSGLPRFADVRVEHIGPAIDVLIVEVRRTVEEVATTTAPPTWESLVAPQFAATERLNRAWGVVSHLNAVVNSAELRDAYNVNRSKVTVVQSQLAQDSRLCGRYRALRASPVFARLQPAQRSLVENELRDFRLGGADLAQADKARFLEIREEQSALMARFEENVLDATNDFALYVEDAGRLAGLPDDVLAAAREEAAAAGRSGWKLTLRGPSYSPVMQHARDRTLREQLYRAYTTRASELGRAEWHNGPLIVQLLALRAEEARMLGFDNYAEVSLAPKMAKSPEAAVRFLREVGDRAKPHAERDIAELREFAKQHLDLPGLKAWDIDYAGEQMREMKFAFSDTEVKQYFPEQRVLAGMFKVVETIFGLHIKEVPVTGWHPDVRLFEIGEPGGPLVGRFYLDLYARAHKRGGAWMDVAVDRKQTGSAVQTPVAILTCNFSRPVAGKPALFTRQEVRTLFHEFGHGLHLLLTNVDYLGVGMDNVEWDAIELPSQFMENFCGEWEVVRHMSGHVDTGTPLPRALFDRMTAARNFHAGLHFVRQLQLALFDLELHRSSPPDLPAMAALLQRVRDEVAVFEVPEYNRFPLQFAHIFASEYAAGYYSYMWAQVLSADAFSLFEELGVLSAEAGRRFRSEILGTGSSRAAAESFVAFRGRPPQIDALFRHNGM